MVQYRFYNLRVFLWSFVYNLQADFFCDCPSGRFPYSICRKDLDQEIIRFLVGLARKQFLGRDLGATVLLETFNVACVDVSLPGHNHKLSRALQAVCLTV